MKPYVIGAFYLFAPLPNYAALKAPLLKFMQSHEVKGTIILAAEGVNGTVCALRESHDACIAFLQTLTGVGPLTVKETHHGANPFLKAKVKLRNEIVTLGKPDVKPGSLSGTYVSPEEWNALVHDEDVIVIDTRNDYEVKLGTFKRATNPQTENFRDFPDFVDKNLLDKKEKKIAMFCTGGIRCEKSTVYLKQLGFQNVYQLDGGILNYLATVPDEKSTWEGACFVFDERVAIDKDLQSLAKGSIDIEWKNKNKKKLSKDFFSD